VKGPVKAAILRCSVNRFISVPCNGAGDSDYGIADRSHEASCFAPDAKGSSCSS
jgi:hypothetical protein